MSDASRTVRIKTTGMHCHSCSMLVDMTLNDVPGVESATTDLATSTSTVTIDPAAVADEDLLAAIRSVGYGAELID